MRKKIIVLVLILLLSAGVGCGGNGAQDAIDPNVELVFVVDLCYVDSEYVLTGDDDISALRYYSRQHIFALPGEQYMTLLDVILRENHLGISGLETMITDNVQFNSVRVEDGTAFVDLAGENLSGGSLEEGLLISQIVYALTGSFDEIERVQFLVDGEIAETLMGHFETDSPFETGIYPLAR